MGQPSETSREKFWTSIRTATRFVVLGRFHSVFNHCSYFFFFLCSQICEEATREINEKAAWALSQFSTRERVLKHYEVDFSLLTAPHINHTIGIESSHRVSPIHHVIFHGAVWSIPFSAVCQVQQIRQTNLIHVSGADQSRRFLIQTLDSFLVRLFQLLFFGMCKCMCICVLVSLASSLIGPAWSSCCCRDVERLSTPSSQISQKKKRPFNSSSRVFLICLAVLQFWSIRFVGQEKTSVWLSWTVFPVEWMSSESANQKCLALHACSEVSSKLSEVAQTTTW